MKPCNASDPLAGTLSFVNGLPAFGYSRTCHRPSGPNRGDLVALDLASPLLVDDEWAS